MRRSPFLVVLSVLALFESGSAFAQSAGLSGEVTDPLNAVVPNATVRVVKQETGVERRTKTNESGFYSVPYLDPGTYQIFVQAPGFETAVREEITAAVGQKIEVNFELRLGPTSQQVNVNASPPLMNTTDATVSTVVDRQFVENLPLNGRSFQALIYLAPGVQINVTDQGQFAVNGQRGNANYFTVDGVSANVTSWYSVGLYSQASAGTLPATNIQGGFSGLVSVDDLQELEVLTSSFSPEFGRSPGAEVILVTRSGTNQYHGALYEYLRNEAFDANDWFANALGFPRAPQRLNDYGGTFGGPVRLPGYNGHDKTFFFFSYENQGFLLPDVLQSIVPTLAARQSATPDAAQVLKAFPKPNGADLGLDGAAYDTTDPTPTHSYDISFRADHRFNDKYSIFGRFNYSPSSSRFLGCCDLAERDIYEANLQTLTLGATQVFNARLVNEIAGNYTRGVGSLDFTLTTLGGAVPPPISVLWPAGTIPAFGVSYFNIYNVGGSYYISFAAGREAANIPHQYQLVDNLSYLHGKHQFKFGVDYRIDRTNVSPSLQNSVYFVNPTPITSGIVTMDSGTATEVTLYKQAGETIDYNAFSAYAQDAWQISPRLSLTYGTRWEINPSPTTVAGQKPYTACCATDLTNLTLSAAGAPYYPTNYHDFAPRLGVAYQILQTPGRQLVVRSGGGIFYDLGQTGSFGDNTWPASNFISALGTPYPVPPGYVTFTPVNPVPSPSNPAIVAMADTNYRLPRTYEWNVTLEQSLGASQVFSAAYVGARGRDLLRSETYPNPNPDYSFVELVTNNGFSSYDSLQVEFTRKLAHGFEAYASYTYSHSIDNASSDQVDAIPAQFLEAYIDKGDSDFDVRHTFNGAFVYTVPVPKMGKVANAFLDNWSIQAIFRAQSALPFNILAANPQDVADPSFYGSTPRANLVPGQPLFLYGSSFPGGKEANPAAFTVLNPGQVQGDLGRNSLRGFGLTQFDFSLMRRFKIRDKAAIEFRVEAFNIFNHPNFSNPSGFNDYVGAAYFGQSQQMFGSGLGGGVPGLISPLFAIGGPRDLQLALRFEF
jgi:Carboxypeptidase regulatory-like domain/TonB dependent receptor